MDLVHGCRPLMFSASTHETTNLRISPCPDLHLVMTF